MTTRNSPRADLKVQADQMAFNLKRMSRKHNKYVDKSNIVFGIVMDDKVLKIDWLWSDISATSEHDLSELIVAEMQK